MSKDDVKASQAPKAEEKSSASGGSSKFKALSGLVFTGADGSRSRAHAGDVVELCAEDSAHFLALGLVEKA